MSISHEVLTSKVIRRGAIFAGGLALVGTVLAGCGVGDTSIDTSSAPLTECSGGSSYPNGSDGKISVSNVDGLIKQVKNDVTTLYQRGISTGGVITLPDQQVQSFVQSPYQINASNDTLSIWFPADSAAGGHNTVSFSLNHGVATSVTAGAIACTEATSVYPNNVYARLQNFVKDTAGLH